MDLADIVTSRKKREVLNRDEKYRYYKNHFNPGKKDQLHQKKITKEGEAFNLSFKYKWLAYHPRHAYSKELSGGLWKACILYKLQNISKNYFLRR